MSEERHDRSLPEYLDSMLELERILGYSNRRATLAHGWHSIICISHMVRPRAVHGTKIQGTGLLIRRPDGRVPLAKLAPELCCSAGRKRGINFERPLSCFKIAPLRHLRPQSLPHPFVGCVPCRPSSAWRRIQRTTFAPLRWALDGTARACHLLGPDPEVEEAPVSLAASRQGSPIARRRD